MKWYVKMCLMMSVAGLSIASTYAQFQNQWFSTYVTKPDWAVSFSCPKQCVVLLWDTMEDIIQVQWEIQWNGNIWYGYMVNNAVYPAWAVKTQSSQWEYVWNITTSPLHKQLINSDAKLALLFDWPITSAWITITQRNKLLWEKWTQFWSPDWIAPFSINLRYWPSRWSWAWPKLAFVLLILSIIIYLISQKHTTDTIKKWVLYMSICIMIAWWFRLLLDHIKWVNHWLKEFSAVENGRFFDLDDYITVTKKIRNVLELDNIEKWRGKTCTIYAKSLQEWPYNVHRNFVYFRPCTIVPSITDAEYTIFYKSEPTVMTNQTVLLTGDSFIFLKN